MQENSIVGQTRRSALKAHKPAVIWFTGLSGSGKSTLANALEDELNRLSCHTYFLDGDNLRHGLNSDLDFTREGRVENVRRVGELACLFADAGLIVLSAFISPFAEDRQRVRELLPEGQFIEVYVSTPLEVCEQRDCKGLYAKARSGEITNFTGLSSPYEYPQDAELVLDTSQVSVEQALQKIMTHLYESGIIS